MKILVTGGRGFIGSAVVDALLFIGHSVSRFDRTDGYDIRDRLSVAEAVNGTDVVIHLAGILGTDELFDIPQYAIDINIYGSVNVIQACAEAGAHYIGITMPPVFPSIYTATKIASAKFATAYHYNMGLRVTHIQAFNAFGSGQAYGNGHPRKIIPALSVEGWNNKPMVIWGDGEQGVDLIHVDDIAQIFVDAVENAPGNDETIDAGTGVMWTVNEVADFIKEITDSTAPHDYRPMRRGEIPTKIVAKGEGWNLLSKEPKLDKLQLAKSIISYRGREVEY